MLFSLILKYSRKVEKRIRKPIVPVNFDCLILPSHFLFLVLSNKRTRASYFKVNFFIIFSYFYIQIRAKNDKFGTIKVGKDALLEHL